MGRIAACVVAVLAVFVLGGCSSGHKGSTPTSSSTGSTTTETSSTTASTSSSTTTTTSPPTTSTNPSSSVRITNVTVSPSSPVSCNAVTTMIELKWVASGATSVDLSIDGAHFATLEGGAQDLLEPLACDSKPHTYLLTAHAGSATATATEVVSSTSG